MQHLDVLPASLQLRFQILLPRLLIFLQALLDVLLLGSPDQLLVVLKFDIAHSRHYLLDLSIAFLDLILPLNHSLLFRMHLLQN